MNFLKYIELSAENLQFFLWYRDYVKRFNALPETERILSPEWTGEKNTGEAPKALRIFNADAAAILKGTDFANEGKIAESEKGSNPFFTPPRTPTSIDNRRDDYSIDSFDESVGAGKVDHNERAAGAFDSVGLKWKPREFFFSFFFTNSLSSLQESFAHSPQFPFSPTEKRLIASSPFTLPTTARDS